MGRMAIIADDLTGASDTGVQFARKGLTTQVLFGGADSGSAPAPAALVIDTDSRAIAPGEARARAAAAAQVVQTAGFDHVFKKVDSTLRGNVGQEIDGILSVLPVDLAVVAPAFPKLGRTTLGGRHLLRGVPLEETEIGRDPKCPVRESQIDRLLAGQSGRKTGLVALAVLRDGPAAVHRALYQLRADGAELVIFDAETDGDLERIASAVVGSGLRVLWVGSAGLADCLPDLLGLSGCAEPVRWAPAGRPALLVAGSVSPTTRAQAAAVRALPGVATVELDPVAVLQPSAACVAELDRCAAALAEALGRGQDAALLSGSAPDQVAAAQAAGAYLGLTHTAVSEAVAAALGAVAARVIAAHPLAGVVLTGGDTAKAVCRRLGVSGLEVLTELEPGVPLSRMTGAGGLLAVTKAGAFGTELTLVRALQALKGAGM